MKATIPIRIAALAALLLSAAACVFPYEVDLEQNGDAPLVVEGDIQIGGTTRIRLSRLSPIEAISSSHGYYYDSHASQVSPSTPPECAQGTIVGEDGSSVESWTDTFLDRLELVFDTGGLRNDQRYRLHLEVSEAEGGETTVYETDWITVNPAPVIDELTFAKNDDFKELWIRMSMHCDGAHYFRWRYVEEWEYHSDIQTSLLYDPETSEVANFGGEALYYCWGRSESTRINTFSTAGQTDDRFEDLSFHTVPLSAPRLQMMYRVTITLNAMSKDAYGYWENVRNSSEGQGSILAPMPSQMAGNVHCLTNPSAEVIGYVDACTETTGFVIYDNSQFKYYEPEGRHRIELVSASNDPDTNRTMYYRGYLPVSGQYGRSGTIERYEWALASCVDCRLKGGNKRVPENWPTGHN